MAKLPPISPVDHPAIAKEIVREWVNDGLGIETQVYVVWFCYILGGWKALVSTTEPDGRYYEVTYNSIKHEAYVDTYKKTHNHAVKFVNQE